MRVLSRTWQMLLKGIAEVAAAGRPLAAAEMVLVRIAYAADLPTPDEVIRSLDGNGQGSRPRPRCAGVVAGNGRVGAAIRIGRASRRRGSTLRAARPRAALAPAGDPACAAPVPEAECRRRWRSARFEDLIALAAQKRDLGVKLALERDVRLVRCEDGRLEIALEPSAAKTLVNDLARKFSQWTSRRWMVVVSAEQGAADGQVAERGAPSRAQDRRARRSAGAGRAGALSRCRDRRRARGRRCRRCRRTPPAGSEPAFDDSHSPSMTTSVRPMPTTILRIGDFEPSVRHRRYDRWPISWA